MDNPTPQDIENIRKHYGNGIDVDSASNSDLIIYVKSLEKEYFTKHQIMNKLLNKCVKYGYFIEKMVEVAQGKD